MKVAKVNKVKVYFDNGMSYDVNYDLINIYKLEEGLDLPFDLFKEFLYESCLLKGYKLISQREYSKKLLFNKLILVYKDKNIVERVINNFEEKAYINDYNYAKLYIQSKKMGKVRLYFELSKVGIDKNIVDRIFSEEDFVKDEKNEIRKLLYKVEGKDYRKKVEYFMRKGYNLEDILEIIKK